MYWPGEELEPLTRRQLEEEDRDILGRPLDLFDPTGERADRQVLCARELAHLEHDVGERARAAGERLSGLSFGGVQGALLVFAVGKLAGTQHPLARPTRSVAAAVGKPDSLAQGRLQHRLTRGDRESMAARLEPDLVSGRRGFRQFGTFCEGRPARTARAGPREANSTPWVAAPLRGGRLNGCGGTPPR